MLKYIQKLTWIYIMNDNTNENKKIKQPKLSLKERYNDDFLENAELRRKALKYQRMHVGQINNKRIEHMIKLLYQVHQNYYFGYFEASCTLVGSMFEQSLMILLEEKINRAIGNEWFRTKVSTKLENKTGYIDSKYPLAHALVSQYQDKNKPYFEVVAGIHNIFKILHVEYVRRLNYLDNPDIDKWGIRIMLRMTF